ncbi:MAG: hypothetical protein AUJ34_01595 [Parcubacteria group bacterium CG1_02_41_12]|nr:MAG: hypothetical protein AUJ34_01595 [Parcubacteria group bacterium CG1_02_41_12]PIP67459.1 MAG: hypothetical protein COW93_00035 [Parcubacteria group bacterium CG22_combo_CG10-13_8_21_14_all_41_9]PIQ80438.1 MAG: hypothetical protein COV79_00435 [Parcubacteria group bacterium CG11_big_fil_rev_8_21_14_0_20_41_14]PIR56993.1 MAG: hypothetical protein COU72_03280 [Parcubacteria group bacterium CG10_big_fil_rev_8_21_14_0_10_41_35]
MNQTATISQKRQFTIPVAIFKALDLQDGDKVIVSHENGKMTAEPMMQLIDRLGGSVKIPKNLKHIKNLDELIKKAKQEYFKNRA